MTDTDHVPVPDAPTLLVAGTASHVGKSTVAAGLCRLLADRGIAVEPFKAQNMSTNARAVVKAGPDDSGDEIDGFGEIGVSQYVQARAARTEPTTDHNPVLLKPRGDAESQLVLDGEAIAHYSAGEYYDQHWDEARRRATEAHRRLAADADVVIAEGAGSIAEINLHDRDLANVETARFADASILLVVDIERGGAFASVVGTLALVPEDVRDRIEGVLITKFRGEKRLLEPGIDAIESRTGVPVVGVLPYDDPGLPEEDSVALPDTGERLVRGEDEVPEGRCVTIAVPRLPRIANFTDFGPLVAEPGVRVSYRPPSATYDDADAIVLPGTKNTVDDLLALRDAGFGRELDRFDGPIVGLCGGYQLLGERITNADVEGTGDRIVVDAFGLLPVETAFSADKRVVPTTHWCSGTPVLGCVEGAVEGYEIHMGSTRATGPVETPFAPEPDADGSAALGAAAGRVLGSYLHGLFEATSIRKGFVAAVREDADVSPPQTEAPEHSHEVADSEHSHEVADPARPHGVDPSTHTPYDRAAALVEGHLDLAWLGDVLGRPDNTQ